MVMKISNEMLFPTNPLQTSLPGNDHKPVDLPGVENKKDIEINSVPSDEQLQEALDSINAKFESMDHSIRFSINKDLKDVVIEIVDRDTGDIIRQIPPEGLIKLRTHLNEMAGVILHDTV